MPDDGSIPDVSLAFGQQMSLDPSRIQHGEVITLDPTNGFNKWMVFEWRSETDGFDGQYFVVSSDVRSEVVEAETTEDGRVRLITVRQGMEWSEDGFTEDELESRLGETLHPLERVDALEAESRDDAMTEKRQLLDEFASRELQEESE